jgi:hypothetical protein
MKRKSTLQGLNGIVKLESFPLFEYMKMDPDVIAHYEKSKG